MHETHDGGGDLTTSQVCSYILYFVGDVLVSFRDVNPQKPLNKETILFGKINQKLFFCSIAKKYSLQLMPFMVLANLAKSQSPGSVLFKGNLNMMKT